MISGLARGGAETMLLKLLERIDRKRFDPYVISLTGMGDLGPRIRDRGIPVLTMNIRGVASALGGLFRLSQQLRRLRPVAVQTWMYHADLLGGIAARIAGVRAIAWGIRNTNLDRDKTKLSTRLVVMCSALASRWLPTGILSNSEVARDAHIARGYSAVKMAIIPNGFDLMHFKPNEEARLSVREELRVASNTPLVGIVGRYDPLKNHAGFLEAAGLVLRLRPEVHFVMIGKGLDGLNSTLAAAARRAGAAEAVHWLGQRNDISRLMASLDVLASSSFGEAFPNAIGEAMACGVPCAVTDAGDSAAIVSDTGRVVSPGDMVALAVAIGDLLALPAANRHALGVRARARVEEHFEIGQVVRRYEDYYCHLTRTEA